MKKLIQKIKLRKFIDSIPKNHLKDWRESEFVVLYRNDKYKILDNKQQLESEIKKHNRDIWYIFDMVDRITLDRDIEINCEKLEEKE